MLVCKNCNVEYEEGKKVLQTLRRPPCPERRTPYSAKKNKKAEEENPDGKLICPVCKIVYEFGSSCIQCGSPLGRHVASRGKEESETARGTGPEEKGPPVQASRGPEIEALRARLICPSCKLTYERGDFCIECGSSLVPQIPSQAKEEPEISRSSEAEGKPLRVQTIQEQVAEAPRKKLICPTCGIIYERGDSCVRCGSGLVPQTPSQEKRKPESSDAAAPPSTSAPKASEDISETDLHQTLCFLLCSLLSPVLRGKSWALRPTGQKERDRNLLGRRTSSRTNPLSKSHLKSIGSIEKRVSSAKKHKRDYRRLFLEVGGITVMALAGAYFLWSVLSPLIAKAPESNVTHF